MPLMEYDHALAAVENEIRKYYDGELAGDDMFLDDLRLLGDDLSAIAHTLERKLRIWPDKRMYRQIKTIGDWARLSHESSRV